MAVYVYECLMANYRFTQCLLCDLVTNQATVKWFINGFCLHCILVAEAWRGIWTRKITEILCGPKRRSVGSSATRDDLSRVANNPAKFLYQQNYLLINPLNNFQFISFPLINFFWAWKTVRLVGEMIDVLANFLWSSRHVYDFSIIPPTYRPLTETPNTTASLWFSVINLSLKHAHGILQTLSLELKVNT